MEIFRSKSSKYGLLIPAQRLGLYEVSWGYYYYYSQYMEK